MNTKSFLIIISICFFTTITTNCTDASTDGGGSASATDSAEDTAKSFTFAWLPEGANTFTLSEISNWNLSLALEYLQLTTHLKEYLQAQKWFIKCRKLLIDQCLERLLQ